MDFSVNDAITAGLGVGSLLSTHLTNRQNYNNSVKLLNMQYDMSKEMQARSDMFQRKLTLDNASLHKQGMQNAGLSVAALGDGNFSSVSSNATGTAPSASSPEMKSLDLLGAYQGVQNLRNMRAQGKILSAQAKQNEVEAKESERKFDEESRLGYSLQSAYYKYLNDKDAEPLKRLGVDVNDSNVLDEVKVIADMKSPYMSLERYKLLTGYTQDQLESERASFRENISRANLMTAVNDSKLRSPAVVDALSHLDKVQYDKLSQELRALSLSNEITNSTKDEQVKRVTLENGSLAAQISNAVKAGKHLDIENDILSQQYQKIKQDVRNYIRLNPSSIIANMFEDGDVSFKDIAKLLVIYVTQTLNSLTNSAGSIVGTAVGASMRP